MKTVFEAFPATLEARWRELHEARAGLLESVESRPSAAGAALESGQWSVVEIVYHLYLVEKGTVRLLRKRLAAGERHEPATDERLRAEWERVRSLVATRSAKADAPTFVVPNAAPALGEGLELLQQSRQSLVDLVGGATYPDLVSISAAHPFETVGLLTGAGWLSLVAAHEERHAQQIELLH
ncbi:MAG TPA: DinB family protein [Terriglobia bacterium]|nr:DinB family protein [Terriglobia bacterium]